MLNNIQFLRAIAASLVVMQHSFSRGQSYEFLARDLLSLEGFGLSGVDIFFVISGFIMSYSQSHVRKSPKEFILGRFVRIVPLYWVWMALIVGIIFVVPGVFRTLEFNFAHIAFSSLFLSQPVLNDVPFIDVGWTLEFEFLFYIIFALTLFLNNSVLERLALVAAIFTFAIIFDQLIMLEFLMGVAAHLMLPLMRMRGLAFAVTTTGILAFLVTHIHFSELHRLWKWGFPSFLLVLGLAAMRGRHNQMLSYLGDASYSIYLVQVASIPLFYKVASVALVTYRDAESGLVALGDILILCSIAFTLVAGLLLHEIFEKPATRLARMLLLPRQ